MARLAGVRSAPPTPWTTRAAMSSPALGRDTAAGGREGEPDDADGEDALAAVSVAERPPKEEEGGQCQRVAGDDPLECVDPPVELAVDGGERDADDGRIEKGDAGAEDGGGDDPAPPAAREGERLGERPRPGRAAGVRRVAHCGRWSMVMVDGGFVVVVSAVLVAAGRRCRVTSRC